jgi:hypothetical protein
MFCSIIMAVSLLAGSDDLAGYFDHAPDEYEIEVQVVPMENQDNIVGSGKMIVKEGESASVNVMLFAGGSYRIGSAQSSAGVSRSADRGGTVTFEDELAAVVDLTLMPSPYGDNGYRIEGTMETMRRVEESGKPRYEIAADPIDLLFYGTRTEKGKVASTRCNDLVVKTPRGERYLRILVNRIGGEPDQSADTTGWARPVTFETEYSLYNEDARRFEEAGKTCSFTCDGRRTVLAKSRCRWYDYFPLPDGDSLLYYTEYWVGDIQWIDDDRFSVRVQVMRAYSTNTNSFDTTGEQIQFQDAMLTQQTKVIATRVGEVLEIVLEKETDPELPFTPLEKIRLKSSLGR